MNKEYMVYTKILNKLKCRMVGWDENLKMYRFVTVDDDIYYVAKENVLYIIEFGS